MRWSLIAVTGPAVEPITVAEAKLQARVDADLTDEDSLLALYITAARQLIERETGRQLVEGTWRYQASGFPCGCYLELPKPALLTVVKVDYIDPAGQVQLWDAARYRVDPADEPGRLYLAPGASWPAVACQFDACQVTFTAGYGPAATDVPEALRQAVRLLVAEWYARREATEGREYTQLPFAVDRLISPYRTAASLVG